MKKLMFAVAAFAAISFASCDGNKANTPAEGEDTLNTENAVVEATAEDSTAAWEAVGDTTNLEAKDSIFQVKLDSILAAKAEAPVEEATEATEGEAQEEATEATEGEQTEEAATEEKTEE